MPLRHQPAHDLGRVALAQQRPMRPPAHSAHQGRQPDPQPHRHRVGPNRRPGRRIHERAATGRQHQRIAGQQTANDPPLALAKLPLAVTCEQLGDAAAGREFDLRIGVAERQSQPRGEPAADRRFASAHQSDQDDAAAGNALGQGDGLAQGRHVGGWVGHQGRGHGAGVACHDPRG